MVDHKPLARDAHLAALSGLLGRHRAVALLGPRQVGKTTLARQIFGAHPGPKAYFDLESARDLARFEEPGLMLDELEGLVVLDEIQRRPELFPALRVRIDQPAAPRFLLLGSASPDLLRQSSESLAGRIFYYPLGGFSLSEVGGGEQNKLWFRGGFPLSFLAPSDAASVEWREAFVATFLERDLAQLGLALPSESMRRFWTMLAHYHGQLWNGSELARSFGVSDHTVRRYLDLLVGTFMVRALQPWFENIGKRQVKAPKIYLSDCGLLHTLLGIDSREALLGHPKLGASWEGFLLTEVLAILKAGPRECFFWAAHTGAELDLLIVKGMRRWGFEFKRTDAPKLTPSMRSALADLKLDRLDVVHAGPDTYSLGEKVRALSAHRLQEDLAPG